MRPDSSGLFSCKSFYESFFPHSMFPCFPFFEVIWKVPLPTKVQLFSWLVVLGKLPICDVVQMRNPHILLSPSWCVLCRSSLGTQDHIFLHCPYAQILWSYVLVELGLVWVHPSSCSDLFAVNLGVF